MLAIVEGYSRGTRYGIHMDADGLLAAGQPGVQLTWMDAKVGDWVVTPRIGKPVEVQALWLNALWIASRIDDAMESRLRTRPRRIRTPLLEPRAQLPVRRGRCRSSAQAKVDASLRPNQIFAVGGLPLALRERRKSPPGRRCSSNRNCSRRWDCVRSRPARPDYVPHYIGTLHDRDAAYHQGTVWPWLIGPFVEAWVRVRGNSAEAKKQAREKFLPPLEAHLNSLGLGHISEITDAEPPFTPRGCPFQAWSLGEYLRLKHDVL